MVIGADARLPEKLKINLDCTTSNAVSISFMKRTSRIMLEQVSSCLAVPTIANLNFLFRSSSLRLRAFFSLDSMNERRILIALSALLHLRSFALPAKLVYSRLKCLKVLYWSRCFCLLRRRNTEKNEI